MPTPTLDHCPICDQPATILIGYEVNMADDIYSGQCRCCGEIHITSHAAKESKKSNTRHLLSAFFRRHSGAPLLVTSQNMGELISGLPVPKTVSEKVNALLRFFADPKYSPGAPVPFDSRVDYPLLFAADGREADFLLWTLASRRYLSQEGVTRYYKLTANGYERIEELNAASYKISRNAFVAMWFDTSRKVIYDDGIRPAIEEAGYNAVRIDLKEHVGKIDDEIIANIRQSRFLVADFTGQRGGVYYEAGFMHGLGRNVLWLVEKTELEKTHFDVRQYNFIDYDSAPDAKTRLYNRIMAVEGKGPGK